MYPKRRVELSRATPREYLHWLQDYQDAVSALQLGAEER